MTCRYSGCLLYPDTMHQELVYPEIRTLALIFSLPLPKK